jgi:hypothetical protein
MGIALGRLTEDGFCGGKDDSGMGVAGGEG